MSGKIKVPVNAPRITQTAKRMVAEAMDRGWVSGGGPAVSLFETRFAAYLGVEHAVAVSSGTVALQLALASLDIGPGDEVIVPDFTMISPVAAVLYNGATPVMVDCDPLTFNIAVDKIVDALSPRTRAILPVHMYGHSADMDPINELARKHHLSVIEDAAEAHGATYKGRRCGALGDISCFSFYGNKLITAGEGGMVLTRHRQLAEKVRSLRDMAHSPQRRFQHDDLGFSYRLGNLQAACAVGQLAHIEEFLAHKQWMAELYGQRLGDKRALRLPVSMPSCGNIHWMYAILLQPDAPISRDRFRQELMSRGVETRDFFQSAAAQTMVRNRIGVQGPFPVSEDIATRGLYLPSGLALTKEEIDFVCHAIDDILD